MKIIPTDIDRYPETAGSVKYTRKGASGSLPKLWRTVEIEGARRGPKSGSGRRWGLRVLFSNAIAIFNKLSVVGVSRDTIASIKEG